MSCVCLRWWRTGVDDATSLDKLAASTTHSLGKAFSQAIITRALQLKSSLLAYTDLFAVAEHKPALQTTQEVEKEMLRAFATNAEGQVVHKHCSLTGLSKKKVADRLRKEFLDQCRSMAATYPNPSDALHPRVMAWMGPWPDKAPSGPSASASAAAS